MTVASPQVKKRSDYRAPDYSISEVDMTFELSANDTRVVTHSRVEKQGIHNHPLCLDGESLQLKSLRVDGADWHQYELVEGSLRLLDVPDAFLLSIETLIQPKDNTSLEGLYLSAGAFCTQCEAEGFRKITYFLDRPDVLAEYKVKIIADKAAYPYLLSNGNKIDSGDLSNGKHWVQWHDPFKKPSYLFALVAGDFDLLEDSFTTCSNRHIELQLFVDKGQIHRGQHALDSLKKAMAWDEQVFGLEYDLDIYMVVAVDFFNMGAMENKGLNIFNSKFVLADAQSATDEDYFNIESVIAHEYFHNWTGNRVTCRDWFQLSLKEGLTVFRDQQFSADMTSPVVNRIKNVSVIREHQFAEDDGAMSHPIRPDEVIEMNNFYTVTVYDKGAEVIRMMHTLLGTEGFRRGMDLYFERHDGQAVTCDDFVNAMQDANDSDLDQFKRWYGQSGTPLIRVLDSFEDGQYTLQFEQINKPTADQANKLPLHIPIQFELLKPDGTTFAANERSDDLDAGVFNLKSSKATLTFASDEKLVPALLGNFSAPVRVAFDYDADQLRQIALFAKDPFCRWDAGQKLLSDHIHQAAASSGESFTQVTEPELSRLLNDLLANSLDDPALCAEMLALPSFETLSEQVEGYEVEALYMARQGLLQTLSHNCEQRLNEVYSALTTAPYRYATEQVNARRLKNVCLQYLAHTASGPELIASQYNQSDNMTDSLGALKAAQQSTDLTLFDHLMSQFESRWRGDALVLDKWFGLHAGTHRADILSRLELLSGHKQYQINNPNRVRALIGTFAFYNPMGFHAADGSGYRFMTDYLIKLDSINPQVSARLVTPLTQWQKLDAARVKLIRHHLVRLVDKPDLSKDLFEKVSKSLNFMASKDPTS